MRRGQPRADWSVREERDLAEMAGRVPVREICWRLKRSREAVKQKAKRMGLSLRCWEPTCAEICPACGMARTELRRGGTCRPCELRALIARADAETAEAMRLLPPRDRATYRSTETKLASGIPPKPAEPDTEGATRYAAAKARDLWGAELEAWEVRTLTRVLKARRRRLERMQKKIPNQ